MKLLRSLTVLGVTAFAVALMFLVGVAPASADGKAITGVVTIPAGEVHVILSHPGKVFSGTITARGSSAGYAIEGQIGGDTVFLTGFGTHMHTTPNQTATFAVEVLRLKNFSGSEITVRFAVFFDRAELKH